MSLIVRCPICDVLLAPSAEGRRAHLKGTHGVSVAPDRLIAMDPMKKAAIVRRVEDRLGCAVISPEDRRHCVDCGPTTREGYTKLDGSFLCDACLGLRADR